MPTLSATDQPISWTDYVTATRSYLTQMGPTMTSAGISATEYVTYGIDNLINYLADLKATGGADAVDVCFGLVDTSVPHMTSMLSVIFKASNATPIDTHGTYPWDVGESHP